MYPRSFLCEGAKIKQHTTTKTETCDIGEEAIWESRFTCFFLNPISNSTFFQNIFQIPGKINKCILFHFIFIYTYDRNEEHIFLGFRDRRILLKYMKICIIYNSYVFDWFPCSHWTSYLTFIMSILSPNVATYFSEDAKQLPRASRVRLHIHSQTVS